MYVCVCARARARVYMSVQRLLSPMHFQTVVAFIIYCGVNILSI
jgi:hypothetical protein